MMDVDNGLGQSLILLRDRFARLESDLGWLTGEHRTFPAEEPVCLENWRVALRLVPCLAGTVFGHPTCGDGQLMSTSEIVFIRSEFGMARSFSRWYSLGTPAGGDCGYRFRRQEDDVPCFNFAVPA